MNRKWSHPTLLPLLLAVLAAGCNAHDSEADPQQALVQDAAGTGSTASAPSAASDGAASKADASAGRLELNDELLRAYARGLEKEAEIIRRPARALPSHMRVQVSALYPDKEADEVLEAAGLSAAQFIAIGQLVEPVLDMLTFQGKLEPRRSIDLEEVDEDTRRRFAADPFDQLPPDSASALRRNLEPVSRPWTAIVRQVAQFD